jgi:hypothetical protein
MAFREQVIPWMVGFVSDPVVVTVCIFVVVATVTGVGLDGFLVHLASCLQNPLTLVPQIFIVTVLAIFTLKQIQSTESRVSFGLVALVLWISFVWFVVAAPSFGVSRLLTRNIGISVEKGRYPYIETTNGRLIEGNIAEYGNQYVVVIGPQGAGKSKWVTSTVDTEPFGVVVSAMSENNADLCGTVLSSICAMCSLVPSHDKCADLKDILLRVTSRGRNKYGLEWWVPTLVLEVDRVSTDGIHVIAREAKLLCIDGRVCRVVLVVNALVGFVLAGNPRAFVRWVEDFTVEEAGHFYDELHFVLVDAADEGVSINATLRSRIFEKIGTRPNDLIQLFETMKGMPHRIDEYIENRLAECTGVLSSFFDSGDKEGMDFEWLVTTVLNSPNRSVKGIDLPNKYRHVPSVAVHLQRHHALLYHTPTQAYRFYSMCMEAASVAWQQTFPNRKQPYTRACIS